MSVRISPGNSLPFVTQIFKRMTHRSPAGTTEIAARLGDRPAIQSLNLIEPGLHLIALETNPSFVEFETIQKFDAYLEYEGLRDYVKLHVERGLPRAGIKETFVRNARALVQAGPADAGETDAPGGMDFEIVALGNPFVFGRAALDVEVLWQGEAAADVQVSVFFLPPDGVPPAGTERTLFRTDAAGRATIRMAKPGKYLLNAVHLEPVDDSAEAMWKSYWASLTFETSAVRP